MISSRHFSESEFKKCTPPCSLQDMNQSAISRFDTARDIAGIPFVINSAYRTKQYELSKGRKGNSAHTKGLALDIRCNSSANRFKIVNALLKVGCNRIGIAKTFVHADFDSSLPQRVIFDYY